MPKLSYGNIIFSACESSKNICPVCKSEPLNYGVLEVLDEGIYYPWECGACEAVGKLYEKTVFDGYEVSKVPDGYIIQNLEDEERKYRYIRASASGPESVEFDIKNNNEETITVCAVGVTKFLLGIHTHPCGNGESYTLDEKAVQDITQLIHLERDAVKYSGRLKTLAGWRESGFNLNEYLRPGDEVDEDLVDEQKNFVPPHSLKPGYLQVGEAYSDRRDTQGRCRPAYGTFYKNNGRWIFAGYCFTDEIEDRVESENRIPSGMLVLEPDRPQVISSRSSTGEVIRDGGYVYKNVTVAGLNPKLDQERCSSLESEVYQVMTGNPHILPGRAVLYGGTEKIETPYVKIIVSVDTISQNKRAGIGRNILKNNLEGIIKAVNDLSNAGYSYNDPLQFAYHENTMKLFDFSNAGKNSVDEAVEKNYETCVNFLMAFGLEVVAERIDQGMRLRALARDTDDEDIKKRLHLMDAPTLELVKQLKATGVKPNNVYYASNARMVQCMTRVGQTEPDENGNKYIVSELPLPQKEMDEWEIFAIYTTRT